MYTEIVKSQNSVFKDHRGCFIPLEITPNWIQSNISFSKEVYTFRGMHLQTGEYAQTKKITVLQGKIMDFLVDLSQDNFGKVHKFILDEGSTLLIPNHFAHGFLSLESDSIVNYFIDKPYKSENEVSIKWDSILEIKKSVESELKSQNRLVISQKDQQGISIENFKSTFNYFSI